MKDYIADQSGHYPNDGMKKCPKCGKITDRLIPWGGKRICQTCWVKARELYET